MSDTIADLRERAKQIIRFEMPPEHWRTAELVGIIDALADECERLQAYIDKWDAGIEMEHIQNTGETFQMTVDRLRRERDEARATSPDENHPNPGVVKLGDR